MTVFDIKPFLVCGPISREDSYSTITEKFSEHKEFKKSPLSKFVTSSVLDGNIHVFYSELGECVGVEVFPPIELVWNDISLLPQTNLKSLSHSFEQKKIETELSDSGLDVPSLGISLFSYDFVENLECSVDSVYISFE